MKKKARKRFTWKAKTSDISDPQKIKKRRSGTEEDVWKRNMGTSLFLLY